MDRAQRRRSRVAAERPPLPAETPTLDDLRAAATRIASHVLRTPVLRSDELDRLSGAALWFKCENLQRGGAFKFRGACNAVFSLAADQGRQGIVTQSSGNHGAAIALASRIRGFPSTVVVPTSATRSKRAAIAREGARIVDCGVTIAERDAATQAVLAERGGYVVPPYNDLRVIAGQSTATLELLDQCAGLDTLIAPVSGGGLLSGTALAARDRAQPIEVWGAEPTGACDAHDSLKRGERISGRLANTLCDGLRAELGTLTFAILSALGTKIALANDAQTIAAMRLLWEELRVVVEPSAAIGLAVVLAHPEVFRGRRIGLILSGGNLDLDQLPWQQAAKTS